MSCLTPQASSALGREEAATVKQRKPSNHSNTFSPGAIYPAIAFWISWAFCRWASILGKTVRACSASDGASPLWEKPRCRVTASW
ncbi:hypothetical protein D9M71_696670 [compost metagenome]